MIYQVLVQQKNGYFRATVLNNSSLSAVAESEERVIAQIGEAIRNGVTTSKIIRMNENGEIIDAPVENPILASAGINKDDPTFEEYLTELASIRKEMNERAID